MEIQQPTASLFGWDKFSDAKESVIKYCSSVVKGDLMLTFIKWVMF
jgi:hypothetical protein